MATANDLRWGLIVALGAVALVRPVLSILDVYQSGALRRPVGPLLITALIAVVWVAVAVARRIPKPVANLTLAGVAYGIFAIVLNLVLQLFLETAEPITVPGMIALIITNAIQGAILGLIAWGVLRLQTTARR